MKLEGKGRGKGNQTIVPGQGTSRCWIFAGCSSLTEPLLLMLLLLLLLLRLSAVCCRSREAA